MVSKRLKKVAGLLDAVESLQRKICINSNRDFHISFLSISALNLLNEAAV
jgi:hypothetical protein